MEIVIEESEIDCSPKLKVVGIREAGVRMVTYAEKSSVWHKDIKFLPIENMDTLKVGLKDADFVFIAVGGNEEAMRLASIVAKRAKEVGALSLSIVVKPLCIM